MNVMRPLILTSALLLTQWPSGTLQRSPALDLESCQLAASLDLRRGAKSAQCISGLSPREAGFAPGWDCIEGYNCNKKAN